MWDILADSFKVFWYCIKAIYNALPKWFIFSILFLFVAGWIVYLFEKTYLLSHAYRIKRKKKRVVARKKTLSDRTADVLEQDIEKQQLQIEFRDCQRRNTEFRKRQQKDAELRERQRREAEALKRSQREKNFQNTLFAEPSKNPTASFTKNYVSSEYYSKTGTPLVGAIQTKGVLAEMKLFNLLSRNFPAEMIFPNVYVEWAPGKTSEIDLVLLHSVGIFVFECKDWNGTIQGNENDKNWIQIIERDGHKSSCKPNNPIIQNKGHLLSISAVFPQIPKKYIFSIIVFKDCCNLQVKSNTLVVHREELMGKLSVRMNQMKNVFDSKQLAIMADELNRHILQPEEVRKKHVEYVKTRQ